VSVHNREVLLDIVVYVSSLQSIDSQDIFPVTDTYKETYAGRNLCMNLILSMDYINKYNLCGNVKYQKVIIEYHDHLLSINIDPSQSESSG